tara:strand:- start:359 stop:1069 length:711 start_codon:yes stop_codon:yes gene_type:complete
MKKEKPKRIKFFLDGPTIDEIDKKYEIDIDGYTFNPSLFKKNGAKDYLNYCDEILKKCKNKPVSLEVIADEEENMLRQGRKLSQLSDNVYVKVPIVFTNGKSTLNVIKKLSQEGIKLNITAIFLIKQIEFILHDIKETKSILSIFAGRLYDTGIDAKVKMNEINKYVHNNSNCQTLWASTRMVYDYNHASEIETDIITMQIDHLKKMKLFNLDPIDYSIKTVKQFYDDATDSGFKF